MQENYDAIAWKSLRQICLPFSHDAGMSKQTITQGLPDGVVLTQNLDIGGQLLAGARWFDIRPFFDTRIQAWSTYHASMANGTALGAEGQLLLEICNQVNNFTNQYAELVVLEISHAAVGSLAGNLIPALGATARFDWLDADLSSRLYQFLASRLNNLYVCPDANADLTRLPMADFIGNHKAAVIVAISDDNVSNQMTQEYHGKGFYHGMFSSPDNFANIKDAAKAGRRPQIYYSGSYSNSDQVDAVLENQWAKLLAYKGDDSGPPFLLEMTMTASSTGGQALDDIIFSTIIGRAEKINQKLFQQFDDKTQKRDGYRWGTYPNLIGVDAFSSEVTDLAIKVCRAERLVDDWRHRIDSALYGNKDVTRSLNDALQHWIAIGQGGGQTGRFTTPIYSNGPFKTTVNNENPLLGPDPQPGVFKYLVVHVTRYCPGDDCLKYTIEYTIPEHEIFTLDAKDLTLRKAYEQRSKCIAMQQAAGTEPWWVVQGVMWGPVNPIAEMIDGFDAGIIIQKRGIAWGQWAGATGYQTFTADEYHMTGETDSVEIRHLPVQNGIPTPLQLRVLIAQTPVNYKYNRWNTLTYSVRQFSPGETGAMGPEFFPT